MTDTAAAENPRAVVGGNSPPPDPIDALFAPVLDDMIALGLKDRADRVREIVKAANTWNTALGESGIQDEATANKCEDFLSQVRLEVDLIKERQATLRKPHDDAIDKILGALKPLGECLRICTALLKPRKEAWLIAVEARNKAEAKRLADEAAEVAALAEAARKAAETGKGDVVENTVLAEQLEQQAAEAQEAAVTAADAKVQVRGDFSPRASGFRTAWSAEITDVMKALRYYKADARILEALQKCADADCRRLKDKTDIPGVKAVSKRTV